MSSLVRWHTDPQEPDFFPDGKKEALHLDKLVDSGSYNPLYESIENKINEIKKIKGASAEENESALWLRGLLNDFDIYVTRELHRIHYPLWAREWEIRNEYKQYYTRDPNPAWNIRAVMARLMTFKEIQKHVKDETFWHRPETRPVYSLDCLSGGIINDQTRPWKYVTGINPVHPRRGYMLTYEKPWIGKQLDPMHHWGVYMDKKLLGISDRYFMACCGELVGQTEGCWINLPEAKTKGAIEGVIQPYQLFPTVFNNVWENIVTNNSFPAADQIKEDYNIGTAFRDITKYDNLHKEIQSSWANASKIIPESFKSYAKEIQDHLDANDSDAGREINPFENPKVLTPQGRTAIETPIQLVLRYNEIQCMGALVPPLIRDYVNEKIFRVADMLKYFTYERMGGIEYEKIDKSKGRIKMLKPDLIEETQLNNLENTITNVSTGVNTTNLATISTAITSVKDIIKTYNSENKQYKTLKQLDEDFKTNGNSDKTLLPGTLDWSRVQGDLTSFETSAQDVKRKQAEINTALKSLRKNQTWTPVPTTTPLRAFPVFTYISQKDLDDFQANIEAKVLQGQVQGISGLKRILPLNPTSLNNLYDKVENTQKEAERILTKTLAELPLNHPSLETKIAGPKTVFNKTIEDVNQKLRDEITKLNQLAGQLVAINNSGASDTVKIKTATQLKIDDQVNAVDVAIDGFEDDKDKAALTLNTEIRTVNAVDIKAQQDGKDQAVTNIDPIIFGTTVIETNPTSIDEIRTEVQTLLDAVKPLESVRDFDQIYVQFDKVAKTIPEAAFLVNVSTEDQKKFVDTWKSPNSLLSAAKNLANALKILLTGSSTDRTQVNNLLNNALVVAENAANSIESIETRRARDRDLVQDNKKKLYNLVNWLSLSGDEFIAKAASLGLWTTAALRDAKIVKFTAEEKKWPVFTFSGNLPYGFDVDEPTVSSAYEKVYLTSTTNKKAIENTWKAFGNYILYRGTLEEGVKKRELEDSFAAYSAALPNQPRVVTRILVPVKLNSHEKEFNQLKTPDSSMFYDKTFIWELNSCWIDSTFLSLFAYPKNKTNQHILSSKEGFMDSFLLDYMDAKKPNTTIAFRCTEKDLQALHESIVKDIVQVASPLPKDPVCVLRTRNLWTKCVEDALEYDVKAGRAEGGFNTALSVVETIKKIYNIQDMEIQQTIDEFVGITPSSATTRLYIVNTGYSPQAETRTEMKVTMENSDFILHAVVCGSGGHFVTYLRDFSKNNWMYIDVKERQWNKDINLPADVHRFDTPTYKPTLYFYSRKQDIELLKPKPAPVLTPTVVWTPSVDSFEKKNLDEANKLLSNWYNVYNNSSRGEKFTWATDLKLLDYANNFISEITVEEHVKNAFVMPKSLWNDDTRRKALGYAYAKFQAWLDETDATKLKGLEADMRKALVAAQITEKPFDFTSKMSLLSITFLPTNRKARDMFVALINRMKKETQTNQYWEIQLRKLLVQTQTKFQDLEK